MPITKEAIIKAQAREQALDHKQIQRIETFLKANRGLYYTEAEITRKVGRLGIGSLHLGGWQKVPVRSRYGIHHTYYGYPAADL